MQHCLSFIRLSSLKLRKEGFTLLELLVTMAIFGLVVGIGTAQYQAFNRQQMLKSTVASVMSNLRLIQGRALSGEKPAHVYCDTPNTLLGYEVRYINSGTYEAEAVCSGGETTGIKTAYTLPTGVKFIDSFTSFRFLPVAQGVSQETSLYIYNEQEINTCCFEINVSSSGDVVNTGQVAYTLPSPTPSCLALTYVGSTITPNTVTLGQTYTTTCDYGQILDCIAPLSGAGSCVFTTFNGTSAQFSCTATNVGTSTSTCYVFSGTPNNCCPQSNSDGMITVTPP